MAITGTTTNMETREKSTASTLPSNSTEPQCERDLGTLPSFLFCSTCNQPTNPTKPFAAPDLVEGHGESTGQCWRGSQTDSASELASSGEGNGTLLGAYYVPGSLPQFTRTARVPHKASISRGQGLCPLLLSFASRPEAQGLADGRHSVNELSKGMIYLPETLRNQMSTGW